jgi:hypothetical protein
MKSELFNFKSLCCMAIALSVLVLLGGLLYSLDKTPNFKIMY